MPSLRDIAAAGLSPLTPEQQRAQNDPVQDILKHISGGVVSGLQKREEAPKRQLELQNEQIKLYNNLREAGYSPEEAHKRVSQTGSTSFIQRLLSGEQQSPFAAAGAPSGEDKVGQDKRKTESDIKSTEARAEYYSRGGAAGYKESIDKMTPNQLQSRLSFLLDYDKNPDYDSEESKAEAAYINEKIQEKSGYRQPSTRKYKAGDVVLLKDGRKGVVKGYRNGKLVVGAA